MMMAGRDTRTRWQGVFARHQLNCAHSIDPNRKCDCKPRYYGKAYNRKTRKHQLTGRFSKAIEARNARNDLIAAIDGADTELVAELTFEEATASLVKGVRSGVVLNKHGRPYRAKAIVNLESSLRRIPDDLQSRRLAGITRGDIQRMVDQFHQEGLSSSRIRSIVNSTRTLYRWAKERDFATTDPAAEIRLPANDSKSRDRVATPTEFGELLAVLEPEDQVPFAIATYTGARADEIRHLDWQDLDLRRGAMRITDGKSRAAIRTVPIVKPLVALLLVENLRQGRPEEGRVCRPKRSSKSGMLAMGTVLKKAYEIWRVQNLTPINFHECRHTCATWLDHAGVSPKVVSVWMGHKAPKAQPDAAPLTLRTYTHVLSGQMEKAREQLDTFITDHINAEKEQRRTMNDGRNH